ncbi:MAG: PQQ-binding-like beta-propeller repeat protein [Streptosporangiaceae bacterium]|nr:PQQ-binding-like beta-propeller repeat protein [Streptosporangiaceae bacterium]
MGVVLLVLAGVLAGSGTAVAGGSTGLTCSTSSGSWPMYQGDPTRAADACSSLTTANVPTMLPAWFFPTAGDVTATPTVVNGTVYAGDTTGAFYAISQSSGAKEWEFNITSPQSCFVDQTDPYTTAHAGGFGEINSSAAVVTVAGTPTVFVGAGGSVFALNANTGQCLWAQDTDPVRPGSAIEVLSSPVVDTAVNPPEVLVGNDDNGSPGITVTGLMAFNAQTGALLWKYEPERDLTLTPAEFGGSDALTLSCGDGVADTAYCNSANIPDLAPNASAYADACGDVWSSPAVDTSFTDPAGDNTFEGSGSQPAGWSPKQITATGQASQDGLAVFGTADCGANPTPATAEGHGDYVYNQGVFGLDPVTGARVWSFVEPYNSYDNNPNEPNGGDDDFGSSPILSEVPSGSVSPTACAGSGGSTSLVIEGSKDGYAYGLCEATGATVWSNQIAQPGQLDQASVGSVGGFIASPSLGAYNGKATVFFDAAIPLPFSNDGIFGSGDTNITACPGAVLDQLPLLPVCPDLSLLANPSRLLPLSAVDAATGTVDWQAASVPTYAATSYTNGVVFAPETLAFSVVAYNAATGTPLWTLPLGSAPSSAAAIAGNGVYLGAGTSFETLDGVQVPPQATGVWGFTASTGG